MFYDFISFYLFPETMAQQVIPVPNPKFQVSGLQTTASSIVSHRNVKIPATFATTYTGQKNGAVGVNATSTTMKFNIADNENFVDLSKFMVCFDVTWIGPKPRARGGVGLEWGKQMNLVYDQSTQAFVAQLTFGSPQGMKFEEIDHYNLFANLISQHTESSMHKERSLLDFSEFVKENDKSNDLRKLFDGKLTFIESSRIRIGVRTRIFLRFHHSSWLNNQAVLPLFLLRNGIECNITLESPHKMIHFGPLSGSQSDFVLTHHTSRWGPNFFIGTGITSVNTSGVATRKEPVNALVLSPAIFPIIKNLLTCVNENGIPQAAPSMNTLWLPHNIAQNLFNQIDIPRRENSALASEVCVVPISIYELGTLVWSGVILIDPDSHTTHVGGIIRGVANTGTLGRRSTLFPNTLVASSWVSNANLMPKRDYDAKADSLTLSGGAFWVLDLPGVDIDEATFTTRAAASRELIPQIDQQEYEGRWHRSVYPGFQLDVTEKKVEDGLRDYVLGFPMYSLNDQQPIPYINLGDAPTAAELGDATVNLSYRNTKIVFHVKDTVTLAHTEARAGGGATFADNTIDDLSVRWEPVDAGQNGVASALALWNMKPSERLITYKIEKAEMLMRLLKPTSEEFGRWQAMFQQPSGIPIKMNSVIYRKQSFTFSRGVTQVNLPLSVRSLKQIFFVIQDPVCDTEPANTICALSIPNLSTFQSRRLTRYEVIVGGQQYPVYPLMLKDTNYTDSIYGEDHIPELESAFGAASNSSFNPSFSKAGYKQVRNLLAGGYLDQAETSVLTTAKAMGINNRCCYVDTASKVFGMSICKDEVNTFATGIDSSQSGAISMNLYFADDNGDVVPSSFQTTPRNYDIHIFAVCDAVVTMQEAANFKRQ